jgi:sulfite dehydrogenase (cytochrome) subunit B
MDSGLDASAHNCEASASPAALALVAALASPISYTLPEESATFKGGPGVDVVKTNCTACHSADYINTQPRAAK